MEMPKGSTTIFIYIFIQTPEGINKKKSTTRKRRGLGHQKKKKEEEN